MNFFEKYTNFIKKHQKLVFIFMLLLIILSIWGIFKIKINTDFTLFMPKHSSYKKRYDEMNKTFGTSEQMMFLLEYDKNLRTIEGIKKLRDIQNKMEKITGVSMVIGPTPEKIPVGLTLKDVSKVNKKDLNLILKYIDNMDIMKSLVQKDSKNYASFTVMVNESSKPLNALKNIEKMLDIEKVKYYVSGDTYLQTKVFDYLLKILLIIPPLSIIIIFATFKARIRSLKATIFSVFPAGIGALLTLGFLGWFIGEISVMTVLVPIFVIVLGSADGLHFMSHYIEYYRNSKNKELSISKTLKAVGVPMIMTTLTTMIGFLSMLVIQSDAIKQLGMASSIGVFLAGIATWIFLPLIIFKNKKITIPEPKVSKVTTFLKKLQGKNSIIITLILIIISIPGILKLQTNFNMLTMYKKSTEVRKGIDKISEVTGGSLPIFLTYKTNEDILSTNFSNEILLLEKELKESGNILKAVSYYDILSVMNNFIYGKKEYPQNSFTAKILYSLASSQNKSLKNFILPSQKTGKIILFPKNLKSKTLKNIETLINKNDEKTTYTLSGIPLIMDEMNRRIIPDQLSSLILATVLVFIMILITQKNFFIALFSIIPISVTLLSLFGIMGYTGIDLSIITSIMSSLTIGVGIDYAIHYSGLYRHFKQLNAENPADEAFNYVSTPILANAFGLAFGFSSMIFSPLQIHTYLVILMWTTMVVSSVLSLTLLPTLVKKLK
ncbi:RND transporter [Tepiditoga spiralis]|uniref:RND transporter n=1 Tax=Tepiditoga spiralis TaxID=2108365 RepID=A0A7G1G4R0_9BACT|nr:MMPL family transporter [Tepiditoga spiralis]BBE29867.1 RND transporter [Tepiditoga spiralis]